MGVAKLSKVTVIIPRSEYQEALTYLGEFEDFHNLPTEGVAFDPATEELAVRAVRLFAQTDQAVKSLSIPLAPPILDVIFRGTTVPETQYEASRWKELLEKAEVEARPIVDEVSEAVERLTDLEKKEHDAQALVEAIRSVSNLQVNLAELGAMKTMKGVIGIVENDSLEELRRSLSDMIVVSEPLAGSQSVVLVAGAAEDGARIDRALRTLEVKPIALAQGLPPVPPDAYRSLNDELLRLASEKQTLQARISQLKTGYGEKLVSLRELANVAHVMLDEVRRSGKLNRLALLSGYIPASREGEFFGKFARWILFVENSEYSLELVGEHVPKLMTNPATLKPFEKVTESQGTPGEHEVDPTPIISFFFPIFFGMMFGDLGHGLVVTAFGLLLRSRSDGNLKQWGTIFTAAGISASVFGLLFGEIFGFSIGQLVPLPTALEIVAHSASGSSLSPAGISAIISISLLIGLVHITLGLSLSVYQAVKAHERLELVLDKLPALVMYLGGIGFGLAFIGGGYSFKGILSNSLGLVSIIVILPALLVTALGKGIATVAGRLHEDSAAMAFMQGVIELLVRIAEFVANTISYARLAILLLVHAALLMTVNMLYYSFPNYLYIVAFPIAIFNILIILLEGLIVYIQDMRLHLYEWFTKFYEGTGVPFRKILPDRQRIRIRWL